MHAPSSPAVHPSSAAKPAGAQEAPRCPNCGAEAPLAYCPACGQTQDLRPPTIRRWSAQFLDDVFGVDGRLPRTLARLLRSPGGLTEEWLAGRRVRYLPPLRLYLLCSVAMFATGIALRFIGARFGVGYLPQGAIADDTYAEIARRSATHALFVLVPLSAVWLKLFFWRSRRLFIEHLVFSLHVHAFVFVAAVGMYLMVFTPASVQPWLQLSFQVAGLVYLVLALRRVHRQPMLLTAAKGIVLFVVHGAAVGALMMALIHVRYDPPQPQPAADAATVQTQG